MSVEALEAIQKLVLKSCNIQHAYLHVPLAAFEDSGFFCILYSLTDKALTAEIESEGGKLTERQAVQKVAQPCLTALADLHAKGIAHGALLPHNILFNSQETACKLAGLFLPSQLSSVQSEADLQRFAAPEQDCSSLDTLVQSASAASDVFMLGAMTYEVLVGKHAFPVKNDGIGRARRWQDPELPLWLSDHAQDFLSRTLLKDAAKRSSAAQLLKHPWLKSLGFKQSMDQIPSSIEVVEPVLPPRPVLLAPPQHVTVAQPSVVQPAVSDEPLEKVQMPEEIAVTATATVAEPVSPTPLNRSGRKHSDAKGSEALETGWDLFYRSGNSGSKAKPKPKVSSPKAPKAVSAARRNSAPPGNKEAADKTS
ncbi:MAG: CDPK-related kinase [Trebouxia sp. A1-2]|nr:MAG: CDPK-related kinase [Trebouxia sp. A1-2]